MRLHYPAGTKPRFIVTGSDGIRAFGYADTLDNARNIVGDLHSEGQVRAEIWYLETSECLEISEVAPEHNYAAYLERLDYEKDRRATNCDPREALTPEN